jgi:hypothetical protein
MPRLTHKITAALLTFTLGLVAANLWFNPLLRNTLSKFLRPTIPADSVVPIVNQPALMECQEWAGAEVASQGLGWDLTYLFILKSSGVCPGHIYCEVAAEKPQPPVNKHFAEWEGDPIVSSILIELPDGHADMMAMWLIRTKEHAYWWGFHPHQANPLGKLPVPTQDYDRVFEAMVCWRQDEPSNRSFFEGRGDGYIGFLSLYKEGRSRQMLLSSRDLFQSWPKGIEMPDEADWGRFLKTMKPIYSVIKEQRGQSAPDSK